MFQNYHLKWVEELFGFGYSNIKHTGSLRGRGGQYDQNWVAKSFFFFFVFFFFFCWKWSCFPPHVFFCFVLQFGRPTLWPAHPITPLLDKRGLTPVSVSIPRPWGQSPLQASLGTDGWLLWNPQVHTHHHFQRMLWVCCCLCCYKCSVHVCLVGWWSLLLVTPAE